MAVLIRGAHVYAPVDMGTQDVMFAGGRLVRIAPRIVPPSDWDDLEEVDGSGKVVTPGLVDPHIHIAGAGGEGGPSTRNYDIQLTQITRWGVTTVVGLLGVDIAVKNITSILARAAALKEEGITAYAWTGGYVLPSPTLTGSVMRDIAFAERIVGVKLAISDHRGSQPSPEDIYRLAA